MESVSPVDRAASVARRLADAAERGRTLPTETAAALRDAGLFTMCLPAAYGGPPGGVPEMIDAVALIAAADASAGWCCGITSTTASLAAWLEPAAARTVFTGPTAVVAGVFAPNGRGTAADGGFRVTGRWQWGSATHHCDWIVGGAMCDDGTQRICFFRPEQITWHDTWYAAGMRGTGSADISVEDAFVPAELTIIPAAGTVHVDDPIARFPSFTLLALGLGATALGNARRALDELVDLAQGKVPQFSSKTLSRSGFAQTEHARAEARWRAADRLLRGEVADAWAAAVAGDDVTVGQRVSMRLAAAHAAAESVAVTETAWMLAGGSSVYESSVLGRCLRDAHVVTQHIMVAPKLNETLGKFLLGADFDAAMI